MNYSDTLLALMSAYPSLYPDEADALHSLFLGGASGHHWQENGELGKLRSVSEEVASARQFEKEQAEEGIRYEEEMSRQWKKLHPEDTPLDNLGKSMANYWRERLTHLDDPPETKAAQEWTRRRTYLEDQDLGQDCWYINPDGSIGTIIHKLDDWHNIFHIPNNITPDWLAATRRTLAIAKTQRFRLAPGDAERLKAVEEELDKRFP